MDKQNPSTWTKTELETKLRSVNFDNQHTANAALKPTGLRTEIVEGKEANIFDTSDKKIAQVKLKSVSGKTEIDNITAY